MWALPLSHPLVHLLKIESGLHSCLTEAEFYTVNSAENQEQVLWGFKKKEKSICKTNDDIRDAPDLIKYHIGLIPGSNIELKVTGPDAMPL